MNQRSKSRGLVEKGRWQAVMTAAWEASLCPAATCADQQRLERGFLTLDQGCLWWSFFWPMYTTFTLDCPPSMGVACMKSVVIHMGRYALCGFSWEGKHKIKKNIKLIDSSPQRSWLPEYCQHVPSTKLISIIVTPKRNSVKSFLIQIHKHGALGSLFACLLLLEQQASFQQLLYGHIDHDLQVQVVKVTLKLKGIWKKNWAKFKHKAERIKQI